MNRSIKASVILTVALLALNVAGAELSRHKVKSHIMDSEINVTVVLPESYAKEPGKKYPVLYLLHGAFANNNGFPSFPSVKQAVDNYKFIAVSPDAKFSWYIDSPINPKSQYETFCAKELVQWVDSSYRTIQHRKSRGLCGFSMGGHGALYLGTRHKDIFGTGIGLSAGADIRPYKVHWKLPQILGPQETHMENWEKHTLINVVKDLKDSELNVYLDCGVDDIFIKVNRNLHEQLLKQKVGHHYIERPGKHDTDYWQKVFPYAALFFTKCFMGK